MKASRSSPGSAPRRARTAPFWAWVPGGLLVGLLGTQLFVLANVLQDPHFAVEPDYYRKAIDWDARMRLRARSEKLGWQLELRTPARPRDVYARALQVALADSEGRPIAGATVFVKAFHLAHSDAVVALQMTATGPGEYQTRLPSPKAGLWELRFRVELGSETFVTVRRRALFPTGALSRQGAALPEPLTARHCRARVAGRPAPSLVKPSALGAR